MSEINLSLFKKQMVALNTPATEVLYGGAAGGGKALSVGTPIPTPSGWSTMGELKDGDEVFGVDGEIRKVIFATPILHDRPCYEVEFSCGEKIVADAEHVWLTKTISEREKTKRRTHKYRKDRRFTRGGSGMGLRPDLSQKNKEREHTYLNPPEYQERTTQEIFETQKVKGRNNHSVPSYESINTQKTVLPIHPYVLGSWLGDGNADGCGFTTNDIESIDNIKMCGYEVSKRTAKFAYGILGLQKELRENNLLKNKHIPKEYFRSHENDRLYLVQGLMDTDGCANKNGSCEFTNTNKGLADGLAELLRTLGVRCNVSEGTAKLNGRNIGKKYTVKFTTSLPVFALERKLKRQKHRRKVSRMIVSVKPVDSVPVRCIMVEGWGNFLCGKRFIPTHNSHLMRIAAITWCAAIGGLQVYLFRRVRDDLIKTHLDSPKGFRNLLAPWVDNKWVKIKEDVIEFWNGSRIYLCHCQHETDVGKYLSAEFHVLLIDELTTFSENMYRQLRARVRMVGIDVPEQYKGQFPRILCGSNPGNVGHLFVKSTFVDDVEPLKIADAPPEEGGMKRQYIPARVNDNPALIEEDPNYVDKLKGIGSEALVRAMLEGDWDIVEGAFFDCWDQSRHVVKPFKVPDHWMKFMSGDWGSRKPFAFHWFAVASDDTRLKDGRIIPRGALVVYKEWYGSPSHKDVGLKLTAEEVGQGLQNRCTEELSYSVLDPAAFNQDGGPSIAERIYSAGGPMFIRADNKRVARKGAMGGWDILRARLVGDEEERPMIFFFSNCVDIIRTLPAMQHDQNNPEDLNCWVAGTMISTPDGDIPIEDIEVGQMVDTPIGPREVLQSYQSGVGKTTNVTLGDGTQLKATPDHKVYVEGKGLLELEDLSCYDILLPRNTTWQQKLLNIMVSSTKDTKEGVITTQTEPIWRRVINRFTDRYGWTTTGKFPLASTSTTSTTIETTTTSPTLSASTLSTTYESTLKQRLSHNRLLRNGGLRMKGRLLYPKMREKCLSEHQRSSCRAEIVETLLKLRNTHKSTAQKNAPIFSRVSKSIKSVLYAALGSGQESIEQKKSKRVVTVADGPSAEVYNLTVADANLFYANGILSSNTNMEDHAVDSVRYGCMSRPYVAGKPHINKNVLQGSTFNDMLRQAVTNKQHNEGYI